MATIRVVKNSNYTVMSNYHLQDMRLSLKAVGLLSKLLSLRDDWEYTVDGLTKICKEGKDAITAGLKELEACGYLARRQTHDAAGKLAGMEYTIYEEPQTITVDGKTANGEPLTDYPLTEKPLTENPPQLNTKISSTDIPPIVPQTGDGEPGEKPETPSAPKKPRERNRPEATWKPERFNALWAYYPPVNGERPAKARAVRAWDKLKPSDDLIAEMAHALQRQKRSRMWSEGIGIPYLSTWLNQRMWETEVAPVVEQPREADSYWADDPEVY